MKKKPLEQRFVKEIKSRGGAGRAICMEVLDFLSQYQEARNSRPKERRRDFHESGPVMMQASVNIMVDMGWMEEPQVPECTDEELKKYGEKAKEEEKERGFWSPVISLRHALGREWWQKEFYARSYPVSIYMARDFRLDITDEEWEEIDAITYNYGTDARIIDYPVRPTAMDYLDKPGSHANMSEIIGGTPPEKIARAQSQAARKAEKMRGKLLANPEEYLKTAAIVCATNGYINAAVTEHLKGLRK